MSKNYVEAGDTVYAIRKGKIIKLWVKKVLISPYLKTTVIECSDYDDPYSFYEFTLDFFNFYLTYEDAEEMLNLFQEG